jgi:adenine specific DNA methylase Mod
VCVRWRRISNSGGAELLSDDDGGISRPLDVRDHGGRMDRNALYYGDNLPVLRESIADQSVDLVYLDPPFNSNASYNVLFKAPSGEQSQAQIEAFEDTWHWNEVAERAFDEVDKEAMIKAGVLDTPTIYFLEAID